MSFEEKLSRLEKINEEMRVGGLGVEKAMTLYAEGIKLASSLEKEISKMERKVEILVNKPDAPDEEPILELFSDSEKN